ncbi:MAG: hypothetical protein ACJ759_04530 [Thermoanaerobaculia bacterium]
MIHRKCWTAAICLGLMTLLGGDRLSAAGPVKKQSDDAKAKMEAQGWKQISQGVFERQLGPNKDEHLGFGREGLSWTIGELSRKLEFLRQEQESYPSEELDKIVDELTAKIAGAKRELWNMDQELSQDVSSITANVTGPSCSSICYSATADAYYLTNVQGVAAVSQAKFNSTCGYSGDTYAYAYARATLNGTTTIVTQSDPHTGTNVTSNATASVNGGSVSGIPCHSEANSYAQSSALGIAYSTSATNALCPAPPPPNCTVTITGTNYEYFTTTTCRSRTWTANVSGGCATPITYQWKYNGTVVGTASTYTRSVCPSAGSFTLQVIVNGGAASYTHYVTVESDICGIDCNCGGPGQPACP